MAALIRISNLPVSVDSSLLEDMFTMVGNVKSARIQINEETGQSDGVGYVEMHTQEEVDNCILHFHGQAKLGRTLSVREDKPSRIKPAGARKQR